MQFIDFMGNETLKMRLDGQFSSRGLSHAYILSGPTGAGKHTLARILTAAYLCEARGPVFAVPIAARWGKASTLM